jgi:hypothetical protein
MQSLRVTIPEGLSFEALKLTRKPTGISFDWAPVEAICDASGIDINLFRESDEGNVAALIVAWYAEHLQRGGVRDAIADDLIGEAQAEDTFGAGLSHKPGKA